MRETARDHTPMTALPYYRVAARAVPAITATPCGGYPQRRLDVDVCNVEATRADVSTPVPTGLCRERGRVCALTVA